MTGYLLDTDIVSMLAPSRGDAAPAFVDWLRQMDGNGEIHLSVVTVHEIEKGIALLEHRGARARANVLKSWLAGLLAAYDDKIVDFDVASASASGRLEAKALASGHDPGLADSMIAGIAIAHDFVVVTRNARHFLPFRIGVRTPDDVS